MSKRNNKKREYLLRGMVKCGECKRTLTGQCPDQHHRYYRCPHAKSHFRQLEAVCSQRLITAEQLEQMVWSYVLSVWQDEATFERALYEAQQRELDAIQPKRERLQKVTELIAETERQAGAIATALRKARGVVSDSLSRDMTDVQRRYEALCAERDTLQSVLDENTLSDAQIKALLRFRSDVFEGIQNAPHEDMRRVLEFLRVEAIAKEGWVQVTCCVPTIGNFELHTTTGVR